MRRIERAGTAAVWLFAANLAVRHSAGVHWTRMDSKDLTAAEAQAISK